MEVVEVKELADLHEYVSNVDETTDYETTDVTLTAIEHILTMVTISPLVLVQVIVKKVLTFLSFFQDFVRNLIMEITN